MSGIDWFNLSISVSWSFNDISLSLGVSSSLLIGVSTSCSIGVVSIMLSTWGALLLLISFLIGMVTLVLLMLV